MRGFNESYAVAFLFATHDPRVVERARRIVTLHDGAIESDVTSDRPWRSHDAYDRT